METYTPGSLREEFLKALKKELEIFKWKMENKWQQNLMLKLNV